LPPAIFLYQAGYLTLRGTGNREKFILVTPNEEVTESMLRLTAGNLFAAEKSKITKMQNTLVQFFKTCDIQKIIQELNGILSLCSYDTYEVATTSPASYECYNRDVIAAFLAGTCEIDVSKEVFGSIGRADIVTKLKEEGALMVYIFELKMLKEGKKPESVVQEAKDQILKRRYTNQHFFTTDNITAFAIALDKEQRNIAMYDTMELKKYDVLEKPIHVSEISSIE
jgi:hypothetical protein